MVRLPAGRVLTSTHLDRPAAVMDGELRLRADEGVVLVAEG